ncbi:MAG: S1C family serine protease [Ardenticatenaceae bacterium]
MRYMLNIFGLLLVGVLCFMVGAASVWLVEGSVVGQMAQEAGVVGQVASPSPTPIPPSATPTPSPAALSPIAAVDARVLLQAEQVWLQKLYQATHGSVVNITSHSYSYDFFFNVMPQEGTGSGFIWDDQGHIVTNFHVIEGAQEVDVKFADGEQVAATVVGVDPANDLAVIRVSNEGNGSLSSAMSLPVGDVSSLVVGQRVVAIGNPFGFEQTLTSGIVSALERVIQSESGDFIGEVIQHDAAINPGNSGGPLLDIDGNLIGVNTQIVSPSGGSAGIGFAIPANTVARVVPELIARGRYPHPWPGIEGFDITPGFAQRLRANNFPIDANEGVLVVGVYRNSPAESVLQGGTERVRSGNLVLPIGGDLIVAINNQPIPNLRTMLLYLESNTRVGDTIRISFWRAGQLLDAHLILDERPRRR